MIDISYQKIVSGNTKSYNTKHKYYTVGGGSNQYKLYAIPAGFDIETSNCDESRTAYMYHWQFAFSDDIYIGRTWDSFFTLLDNITAVYKYANIMILIHNMSFEMSFMLPRIYQRGLFKSVFAKDSGEPLEVRLTNGVIFRDSMSITNLSLEDLAIKYTRTQKLVGDLDYTIPRNTHTKLTPKELEYCKNDVIILKEYAEILHNTYTVNNKIIPMTSTGIVRQYVKSLIPPQRRKFVQNDIAKLFPQTLDRYKFLIRWLFRGGFTHAMTAACGTDYNSNAIADDPEHDIIKSAVDSFDLTSAYPSMMLQKTYPMTEFIKHDPIMFEQVISNSHNAVIFTATFYNIEATGYHVIESKNKIIEFSDNAIFENGRLASADFISVALTDVDYQIYQKFYKWDKMKVHEMHVARKYELPNYLIKSVLHFYAEKKRLKTLVKNTSKDDPNYKHLTGELQNAKAGLNAHYGMTVSKLNLTQWDYDGTCYFEKDITKKDGTVKEYQDLIQEQYLSPYWGIYITAYCRQTILNAIYDCGAKGLYSDTDSVKCLPGCDDIFNKFNDMILKNNKGICTRYHVDFDIYGDCGLYDKESTYRRFKTFGAKRYIYIDSKDDHFNATIAGLPKKTTDTKFAEIGADAFFKLFSPDMEFDISGKNAHHHFEECYANIAGEEMHEYGGTYIYPVSFKMKVQPAFLYAIAIRKERLEHAEKTNTGYY